MGSKVYSAGELIGYSIGGGWGKEEQQGDFQTEVAIIRGADFPSIEQGIYNELPVRWEKKAKTAKASLQPGDIVLEISGGTDDRPTGRTLYITEELLDCYACPVIPASFCRLLRPVNNIDSAYLFFWLQNMYAKGRTWGYQNRSTGLSNFQYKVFAELEQVSVPELETQHAISGLLLMLENKRHLNNHTNDYLLELGDSILRHALDTNASEIEYRRVDSFCLVKGGKRLPKGSNLISEPNSHPYIRVRDLNDASVLLLTPEMQYVGDDTQASISRYIVESGDVIISVVGTIGLTAYIGETLHEANLTENCNRLTAFQGTTAAWVYFYLRSPDGQDAIRKSTVGAVQAKLPLKNIKALEVPFVQDGQTSRTSGVLNAILASIQANLRESLVLASIRDTLLPKLMSGEVDVSQIEPATQPNNHLYDAAN